MLPPFIVQQKNPEDGGSKFPSSVCTYWSLSRITRCRVWFVAVWWS